MLLGSGNQIILMKDELYGHWVKKSGNSEIPRALIKTRSFLPQ
jgi:hypothetical protein